MEYNHGLLRKSSTARRDLWSGTIQLLCNSIKWIKYFLKNFATAITPQIGAKSLNGCKVWNMAIEAIVGMLVPCHVSGTEKHQEYIMQEQLPSKRMGKMRI